VLSVNQTILITVPGKKEKQPLSVTHPELSKEAVGWDPSIFLSGSNRKMNWKCHEGHSWTAVIYERAKRNSGCPFCTNTRVLAGFNDLETLHPNIAAEAEGWDPTTINPGSHKKYKWKCIKGHIWISTPLHRTKLNQGCAVCDNKQIQVGINDLESQFPDIAKQAFGWDPKLFSSGAHVRKTWKCKLGHTWTASIGDMTARTHICPFCSNKKLLGGFNDLATKFPDLANEAYGWEPSKVHPGTRMKKKWKCSVGHIWNSTVNSRTVMNAGCPSCAVSGFDPNKDGFLYLIEHKNWIMSQIGITNYPDDRILNHRKLGWNLIELRGPMDGHLTQQWETAILRMLKAKGADLSNSKIAGKFDGYSEAWSKSTFDVKTIKELMKFTEEFEEKK